VVDSKFPKIFRKNFPKTTPFRNFQSDIWNAVVFAQ